MISQGMISFSGFLVSFHSVKHKVSISINIRTVLVMSEIGELVLGTLIALILLPEEKFSYRSRRKLNV